MSKNQKNDLTRDRILDEAEALFAEKGFHAVSVREITTAAHCNLAAVNYHFGNKENLYLEVFRARWVPRAKRLQESFVNLVSKDPAPSAVSVVRALARAFLEGPMSEEERVRHHRLIARELAQPMGALPVVVDEAMSPFIRTVKDHLRAFVPAHMGEERLTLCILTVFSTVLYFNFARTGVMRVMHRSYDAPFTAALIEHITEFSLRGLGAACVEEPS